HVARAAEDLRVLLVHQPNLHVMLADLRALTLEAQHKVQTRVHRRELLHPDVLEDAQHRELAGLIDDRVVGDDGEVEMHGFSFERTALKPGCAPIPAAARPPSRAARSRW